MRYSVVGAGLRRFWGYIAWRGALVLGDMSPDATSSDRLSVCIAGSIRHDSDTHVSVFGTKTLQR